MGSLNDAHNVAIPAGLKEVDRGVDIGSIICSFFRCGIKALCQPLFSCETRRIFRAGELQPLLGLNIPYSYPSIHEVLARIENK